MIYLFIVSLIWAFSFGLTKHFLVGIDPAFISAVRMGLALAVFAQFLRVRFCSAREAAQLTAIGAVQFGVMYLAFFASYKSLAAYEIALLTVTTPIFVWAIDGALERKIVWRALAAALLAVAGSLVIIAQKPIGAAQWHGVLLVQLSNFCFALGQVLYRRWRLRRSEPVEEHRVFAWLYLGAFLVTLPISFSSGASPWTTLTTLSHTQIAVLLYLGLLASGLGFFLWNFGASRVSTGILAAMNNAKTPLAVAASFLVFGESPNFARLAIGGVLIALAVWLGKPRG